MKTKVLPSVMAFYHEDGLVAAWKQAKRYAGTTGRIGTLPDIIDARIATKPGETPWETYFTTTTAEFLGRSKKGNLILIVAHGTDPLSTLDGIQKAYSWEYNDKSRGRRGGRITQRDFFDLESGKFGEVSIVDMKSYCALYQFPFMQMLRLSQAMRDLVLRARLGTNTERYLQIHAEFAREWHREQARLNPENKYSTNEYTFQEFLDRRRKQHTLDGAEDSDPYIIAVKDAGNCRYSFGEKGFRQIERGYAIAHLISTGALCHLYHEENESLVLDVSCHEWGDGVRFVAIRPESKIISIHAGIPNFQDMIIKHPDILFEQVESPTELEFSTLMEIDGKWFTQYPKKGERMDTDEPEYAVTRIHKVDGPSSFTTTIGGYYGFLKYGIKEVKNIAPRNANAYYISGDVEILQEGSKHVVPVTFYHIEANTSRRAIREKSFHNNYDLLMKILELEN